MARPLRSHGTFRAERSSSARRPARPSSAITQSGGRLGDACLLTSKPLYSGKQDLQHDHLPSDATGWDAIERDYRDKTLPLAELCLAHGITRHALYELVRKRGWPFRSPTRARPPSPEALARRLVDALDQKMRQFEQRLRETADSGSNAADSERDARTLGALVRLFEKLTELHGAGAKPATSRSKARKELSKAEPASTTKETHDQERLRGELARRLDHLRGQIGG